MLTATQAKELAISNRKGIEEILETIKSCAYAGMLSCCFETNKVNVTDDLKTQLNELGYTLDIDSKYFKIDW